MSKLDNIKGGIVSQFGFSSVQMKTPMSDLEAPDMNKAFGQAATNNIAPEFISPNLMKLGQ